MFSDSNAHDPLLKHNAKISRERRGRDRMVVGFTTTYTISAYHHYGCEFETCSWRGVFDTIVFDKACQ
jgi:hypothetical protein